MRYRILSGFLFLVLNVNPLTAQVEQKEGALSDIDELFELIKVHHPAPFYITPEDEFNKRVEIIKSELAGQSTVPDSLRIAVAIMKALALVREGHTKINNGELRRLFGRLPVGVKWYQGKLYIRLIANEYKEYLGAEITHIGTWSIEELKEKLLETTPYSGLSSFYRFSTRYIESPGFLFALGATSSAEESELTIRTASGEQFSFFLKDLSSYVESPPVARIESILEELPVSKKYPGKYFYQEYLEEHNTLYVNIRVMGNQNNERMSAFADSVFAFVDQMKVDKLVIDLRANGGGNNWYANPFVYGVASRPTLNQKGKTYILISDYTFSAGTDLATLMQYKTRAILVGEQTTRPRIPGDADDFALSNSGIRVDISLRYTFMGLDGDDRENLNPDIIIPTTIEDELHGIDPAIEFIAAHSISDFHYRFDEHDFGPFVGTYEYSPDRNLSISMSDDQLIMDITQTISTLLIPISTNLFATEIEGFLVRFEQDGSLTFIRPEKNTQHQKCQGPVSDMPYDLLLAGKYQEAQSRYKEIKQQYPDLESLKDDYLASAAGYLFAEVRGLSGSAEEATNAARALLQAAIDINPKGTSAKTSIQYY